MNLSSDLFGLLFIILFIVLLVYFLILEICEILCEVCFDDDLVVLDLSDQVGVTI